MKTPLYKHLQDIDNFLVEYEAVASQEDWTENQNCSVLVLPR